MHALSTSFKTMPPFAALNSVDYPRRAKLRQFISGGLPVHSPVLGRCLSLLYLSLLCLSLTACGSSALPAASTSETSTNAETNVSSNPDINFLVSYMKDWYLWYDRMPSVDLKALKTPEETLTALKVSEDRYSFIDNAAAFAAFFDEGKTVGFGLGLSVVNNKLFVRVVQPNSNAAAQGIARGDQILSIDEVPMSTLIAENRLDAAIGPSTAGLTARFQTQRAATVRDVTLVKSEYSLKYILAPTVLENAGRKTGYLYFTSFGQPGRDEWRVAINNLLAAGAIDLVVDLRDNGGGLLSIANEIGAALAPVSTAGSLAFQLQFNDRHSSSNIRYNFASDVNAGRFERLAWITSSRTCSASEAMITALLPYRSAARIGETTCGKPVGFTPPAFNGKVYNIVTFKSANRDGLSDYYNGLAADCSANSSDLSRALGDPLEPRLATALQKLATGNCPAIASAPGKSLESANQQSFATTGIKKMTGLH